MKRYLRFSISTLIILTTIVAAYIGGYTVGYKAGQFAESPEGWNEHAFGRPLLSSYDPRFIPLTPPSSSTARFSLSAPPAAMMGDMGGILFFSAGLIAGLSGFAWGRRRSGTAVGATAQLLGSFFAVACAAYLVVGVCVVFFGVNLEMR